MQDKINAKRARAVVVTIALIVATNFAISRAESFSFSDVVKIDRQVGMVAKSSPHLASDAFTPVPGPRPSGSFASDAFTPVPGPRPSGSFASDGSSPTLSAKPLM